MTDIGTRRDGGAREQGRLAGAPAREQTRARYPDEEGYVERDGVRIFWERYGAGEPTVLLLPTWSIVHSRHWKVQIPYLARHCRVITFDGRGNGVRTARPSRGLPHRRVRRRRDRGDGRHGDHRARAGRRRLVRRPVGDDRSPPSTRSGSTASRTSARPWGSRPATRTASARASTSELDTDEGWAKFNSHYWREDYRGFLEFFFEQCVTEPHSTKQIEDCVGWALDTDPETLDNTTRGLGCRRRESLADTCAPRPLPGRS